MEKIGACPVCKGVGFVYKGKDKKPCGNCKDWVRLNHGKDTKSE